jgi:hypothetical protein
MEAPIPSSATLIQGFPFSSLVKTQPPSHGACLAMVGFPEYVTSIVYFSPFLNFFCFNPDKIAVLFIF